MAVRTAPNGENKTQARQNASVDGRMGSEASTGNAVIGTGIEEDTERENGSTVVRVRYFAAARSAASSAESTSRPMNHRFPPISPSRYPNRRSSANSPPRIGITHMGRPWRVSRN